jgi:hypothetical protein
LDIFDDESLEVLNKFSNQAPIAKYHGTIDRIEVFYHGYKEDMTTGLRSLADASDDLLAHTCKSTNTNELSGSVNSDYRVAGVPLALDKAEIKIYITVENTAGVGDKGVFGNQLKSVIGQVMDYGMFTESGEKIEAVFGYTSILKRIVDSPIIMGTTITLLKLIGKKAVEAYKQ